MKETFKILLLLLFTTFPPFWGGSGWGAFSQTDNSIRDYYHPTSAKLSIDGYYGINSNAITNQFTKSIIKGQYIDNDLKNKVSKKLGDENRFGGDINAGIYFSNKLENFIGKTGISYYIGLRDREHFDMSFSKDLFDLGFYGNSRFADDTANFSPLNFNLLRYQQFEFGFLFNDGKMGTGISLLKGEQFLSADVSKGTMFTAADGSFIDVELAMKLKQSDTENYGFKAINGVGISADYFAIINLKKTDSTHQFLFEIKDLGFIKWNKNSLESTVDTALHYDGVEINLRDSFYTKNAINTNLNTYKKSEKRKFNTALPVFLHLAYSVDFTARLKVIGGFKYRFFANYSLCYYMRGIYKINDHFSASAKLAFGGYGKLNFGLGIKTQIGKKFNITLTSDNLEGFILPAHTTGQGAFISVEKIF